MVYLILAVGCSLFIVTLFKVAAHRGLDRLLLITANYAAAWGAAGGMMHFQDNQNLWPTAGLMMYGLAVGAVFIAAFWVFGWATALAGMSLATGVVRMAVVAPVLASWLVWHEVPTLYQGIGLLLAGVAILLLVQAGTPAQPKQGLKATGVLVLLFIVGGTVDTSVKAFDVYFGSTQNSAAFTTLVFGMAFWIGLLVLGIQYLKHGIQRPGPTLAWGVVLGLFNYGSLFFFLKAVTYPSLPGPVIFPLNNISVVIGATLIGVLGWRERLSRRNWIGLGLAALALVLIGG